MLKKSLKLNEITFLLREKKREGLRLRERC